MIINHVSEFKDKNHIMLSVDVEKAFDKIKHDFMMKALERVGLGEHTSVQSRHE